MPDISVIMPIYNKEKYLKDAILSVVAQKFQNWELILINDGSPDNSEAICLEFAQKDKRIRYIKQSNQGVIAARNNAIRQAASPFIFPLDADDTITPDCLTKLYSYLSSHQIDVVYALPDIQNHRNDINNTKSAEIPYILFSNSIPCSALFRKTDWELVGGYHSYMKEGLEDWDFWLSFMEYGKKFHRINEILYHFNQTENRRNTIDKQAKAKLYLQLVSNHSLLYQKFQLSPKLIKLKPLYNLLTFIPYFRLQKAKAKFYGLINTFRNIF